MNSKDTSHNNLNVNVMSQLYQLTKKQKIQEDNSHSTFIHSPQQQLNRPTDRRSDPSVNFRQHIQQQAKMKSSDQLSRNISQAFMNAPTSLANLAQLSGMTLVPVNSGHVNRQDPGADQPSDIQQHQAKISSSSSLQSKSHIDQRKITVSCATNIGSNQQRNTFDIAAIPSIQLLSQQIPLESINLGLNNEKARRPKQNSARGPNVRCMNATESSVDISGSNPIPDTVSSFNRRDVDISASDGVFPELIASSRNHDQSLDDIDIEQRFNSKPTVSFGELCQDEAEQEPNNVSLMRLMAVLNNPALTLTPVGATSSHKAGTNRLSWAGSQKRDESRLNEVQIQKQLSNNRSDFVNQLKDYSDARASNQNQTASNRSTMRIPKSAANLFEAGSTVSPINGSQLKLSDVGQARMGSDYGQSQPTNPLDWLSGATTFKPKDTGNSVTLSWMPNKVMHIDSQATSERSQPDSEQVFAQQKQAAHTISVQMLHRFANQTDEYVCQDNSDSNALDQPSYDPECSPTISRVNVQQLDKGARAQEIIYTVCSARSISPKPEKKPIQTTKERLFIPEQRKVFQKEVHSLPTIHIEATQQKEVLISERHLMLEKMVEIAETVGQRKHAPIEPDDIFVNRSKRIMSRIDTVLEKKERKRFERICHRSSPKITDSSNNSDASDDDSIFEESTDFVDSVVVPIQLPLEEDLSDEKRKYLLTVGLISRTDKNALSLQECEKRLKSISALALQETEPVPDDLKRFIDTIVKTGGTDIQLRTETSIKRNELPFIEGLNRNTSRIKMNYMSALGLDKRSKRTTLYKVTKPNEKKSTKSSIQKHQQPLQYNDLMNKQVKIPVTSLANVPQSSAHQIPHIEIQESNNQVGIETDLITKVLKLSNSSCREEIQVPKDEYMRSLGLMAS